MDRLVRVPVQVFPVLPFVGPSVDGALVNLSSGGMALLLNTDCAAARMARGSKLRVHFRLPGMPLSECRGVITHAVLDKTTGWLRLGVKFVKTPKTLGSRIQRMLVDDETCEARVADAGAARCNVACSFHSLCSKPFREAGGHSSVQFEISLQHAPR